ncbi:hypothetical protein [Paenibacillus durus]|uniref:Uncharacterized protein n=1 Tax=Paenibacillus durus TaxID=44251 RepID=A0A089IQM6_PAEDU|nr:hypothetical protein [Paenibacillus durus]AIQ11339.1 hypothetical protein PDUR_04535 [Paenibacillus durus]
MFYKTKLDLLDSLDLTVMKTIYADIQPYIKSYSFEDGITLEITHRAFCDKEANMEKNHYVRIDDSIFIILDLKEWSDYLELYLYQCKPDFASGASS